MGVRWPMCARSRREEGKAPLWLEACTESVVWKPSRGTSSPEKRRKILRALAEFGGRAKYSAIEEKSGVKSSFDHNLRDVLMHRYHVVEQPMKKGPYELKQKTPLCYIFDADVPIAYIGLLGMKATRVESEPEVALELLKKEKLELQYVYVVSSNEALKEWQDEILSYGWVPVLCKEITKIDSVKNSVVERKGGYPGLEELLKKNIVIMDCTSAVKPATLAFYEIAQQYYVPLIYVYEPSKELKWLISKRKLREKLGFPAPTKEKRGSGS